MTINPLVVENQRDAELVTEELPQRMRNAYEYQTSAWERNTGKARKGDHGDSS